MFTFQDLETAQQNNTQLNFIKRAVDEYLDSDLYRKAIVNEKYYDGENPTLSAYSAKLAVRDRQIELFPKIKVTSGIFERLVTLLINRLWFNGVQLDTPKLKTGLGKYFDNVAMEIQTYAAIHSTAFGFWNYDHLQMFKATEYFSLKDERTAMDRAGIRFWQIDEGKPLIIELYEIDGWTQYIQMIGNGSLELDVEKQAYRQQVKQDIFGVEVVGGENYPGFPIVPIYINSRHKSLLKPSIRAKIDVYDILSTTFLDDAIKTRALYWILTGMSGDEEYLVSVKETIQRIGIISPVEGVNPVNAKAETVELPIQANIQILEWLKREIYSDAMVMDPSEITGGSLTNVAIKTANHAERLKTSSIEWQASLFIERILALADIESNSIVFKQETISNDMEITQRLSQYPELDLESKMKLDPLFPDDVIPEILQRVANNQIGYQEVVPEDPMVSE